MTANMLNPSQDTGCSMILNMGVTGSGKSYFINQLAKGAAVEGHGVSSGGSNQLLRIEDMQTYGQKIQELNRRGKYGDFRNAAEVNALERRRGLLLEQRHRLQTKSGAKVAEKIEGQRKRDKMMSKLTIFGTFLGLAVTVTVNAILPLSGVI